GTAEALRANMAEVVEIVAYQNSAPPDLPDRLAAAWPFEVATLMSGSAATRLATALSAAGLPRVPVLAIGPSTAHAAHEVGLPVAGVARTHDQQGLVDAVQRWLATR